MPLLGFKTRQDFFSLARFENEKVILDRQGEAIYKQADLTLKLSIQVIREGLLDIGRKYLYLALSQSEDIHKGDLYKAIDEYLSLPNISGNDIDGFLMKKGLEGKRTQSYDPPSGFKVYET